MTVLAVIERLIATELQAVRMNHARPTPPLGRRIAMIGEIRVILPLEGIKEEIFGDGAVLHHWLMKPGDGLVLRPNSWLAPLFHTPHRHLGMLSSNNMLRICVTRCPGNTEATNPLIIEEEVTIPMPQGSALHHLLEAIVALDQAETVEHEGPVLLTTVLHVIRDVLRKPILPVNRGDRTWAAMVTHVQDHYSESLGRADVAAALGLSPSYLSRLCRQRAGRSFIDYLNGLRLEHAARMLHHIELPIAEIARSCGFSDAGYFIRRFRRSYGTTPASWRREQLSAVG